MKGRQLNAQRSMLNARFGVTLIEVVISVAIIIAVAVGGLFAAFGYRNTQDLDDAARQIVAVLREAQNRSMGGESAETWGVYFSNTTPARPTYALFKGTTIPPSSANVAETHQLADAVTYSAPASGTDESVSFAVLTGLPVAPKIIRIVLRSDAVKIRTITINANGSVSYQ